ncbi:phosphonate transport system substrate-binding protein [Sulfuritortus calidifontis]|uniref:Phosphonate transport system substrate-binding protein n=1 Tax=Sulfuritortus calidifontis TaxID=1914471 RepID=A0A4R3JYZ7_9PROT|nr:phosphonate transport system substrate-binding protein [Sulfuritortus calidifontis]
MGFVQRIVVAAGLYVAAGLAWAQSGPLVFGVLNQQSPQLTAERWNPVLQYLGEATGLSFQLKMGTTVLETDAMMGRGEFDLIFTNHNFQKEYDGVYKVIARLGSKPVHGTIAVLEDSPIKTLAQLNGKRVAYPSQEAFMAYAVPKVALIGAGIKEAEVFAGNQEGAMAQAVAGLADAVAANSRSLEQYAERKNLKFRSLYTSEPYYDLAIVVHPRVAKAKVQEIQKALTGMAHDPKARAILARSQLPGFEPATDKDYDNVRRVYRQMGQ